MMMASDPAINLLSTKLENLPLRDMDFFGLKPVAEKFTELFCFPSYTARPMRRRRTQHKHLHASNVLFFEENFVNNTVPKKICKNSIKTDETSDVRHDDVFVDNENVATTLVVEVTEKKGKNLANNLPVINVKKDEPNFCLPNNDILSPTFSSQLPSQSNRSPNKRKRSSDSTNLESSPFTRSCDFEVFNICKTDFRCIQRTLSFDDDLLRSDDEIIGFCQRNDSPKNISTKRLRDRPSLNISRMTCRSQPSTWQERKGRKIKVIQIKPKRPGDESKVKHSGVQTSNLVRDNNKEHIFQPISFTADLNL